MGPKIIPLGSHFICLSQSLVYHRNTIVISSSLLSSVYNADVVIIAVDRLWLWLQRVAMAQLVHMDGGDKKKLSFGPVRADVVIHMGLPDESTR